MSSSKFSQFKALQRTVTESTKCTFYKDLFEGSNDLRESENKDYCHPEDLIRTPLQKRTYLKRKSITKIVREYEKPFLVEWDFENLAKENFGSPGKRPLVLLSNPYDSVEKSIWCYMQGVVPLIGENNNPSSTAFSAEVYEVDSVLTDIQMWLQIRPLLNNVNVASEIKQVTFHGNIFFEHEIKSILNLVKKPKFLVKLPEVGVVATSCDEALENGSLHFHSDDSCLIHSYETLVVSKLRLMPTPILKYETRLKTYRISCPYLNTEDAFVFADK